jgi:hypothetical protein
MSRKNKKKNTYFTQAKQREVNKQGKKNISSVVDRSSAQKFARSLGLPESIAKNITSPKSAKNIFNLSKIFQNREVVELEYQKQFGNTKTKEKVKDKKVDTLTEKGKEIYAKNKLKSLGVKGKEAKEILGKVKGKIKTTNDDDLNIGELIQEVIIDVKEGKAKARDEKIRRDDWAEVISKMGGKRARANPTKAYNDMPRHLQDLFDERQRLVELYNTREGLVLDHSAGFVFAKQVMVDGLSEADAYTFVKTKIKIYATNHQAIRYI